MTPDLTFSQEVQTFIDSQFSDNDDDLPVEEREEMKKTRQLVRLTVDDIISSRETLIEGKFAPIEKMLEATPHLIRELLDERFTRDVISAVPGYVSRTLELSRLEASRLPSKITNGYVREAVRELTSSGCRKHRSPYAGLRWNRR